MVTLDDRALSIEDMLDDPLFQELVHAIDQPSLSEPVLAAVDALASGKTQRAQSLINDASAQADAIEDDPAAAEAMIHWSAIERFFEEAELI